MFGRTGWLLLAAPALCLLISCDSSSPPSANTVSQEAGQDTALPADTPAATSQHDRGLAAYKKGMCRKCHGEDGTGSERAPDLTDSDWLHCDGSAEGIRGVLVTGVPKEQLVDPEREFAMNPVTNLVAESELDALASYVQSLAAEDESR